MKNKFLKTVLALALTLIVALGVVACGEGSWKANATLTNPGEVVSNGGAVIETENYIYFVNGKDFYTVDNKAGTPVKGAIMVVEKSALSSGQVEPQMVVSKVIASADYTSGIYLFGDKLYYATPSTKKDTSGTVARDHIEFASSDLKGNVRKELATVNGNSTTYRFAEVDGVVYLVYYNLEDNKIVSLNTNTGKETVVVEEPMAYTFVTNEALESTGVAVIYTKSVKNADTGNKASYNEMYSYKVGDAEGKKVLSGKNSSDNLTYAVTLVKGQYVFYSETRASDSSAKVYGLTVEEFANANFANKVYYKDSSLIAKSTYFVDLNNVYVTDNTNGFIFSYKTNENGVLAEKTAVAKVNASTLLYLDGADIYYVNSDSCIARVNVQTEGGAEEVRVSEKAVATDWYDVKVCAGYMFWSDSSALGLNYLKYVSLSEEVVAEDTDDDGEDDLWYLDNNKALEVVDDDDKITRVSTKIGELSSISKIAYEDGEWVDEELINEARAYYDALDKKLQSKVSSSLDILESYEEYLRVSKLLKDFIDNENVEITANNQAEWQAKIDAVKKAIEDNEWASPNTILIENGLACMQIIEEKIEKLNQDK